MGFILQLMNHRFYPVGLIWLIKKIEISGDINGWFLQWFGRIHQAAFCF
jgi:hypothetical protein